MDKKTLTEQDIRTKFVTPAIVAAGWDIHTQIREEVTITAGRINVQGTSVSWGKSKRADYILYHKPNIPIAIIEAKDNKHSLGDGMQQALNYGAILDVPFSFSTNGDGFLEHDRSASSGRVERELDLENFPSPDELWHQYCKAKNITAEQQPSVTQDFYVDGCGKTLRYYQLTAINRTVEAIAAVKTRIKEKLLQECNLHTIVRLPKGVFNPYTSIRTNLLFFTKGDPTKDVWYYEHPYPEGYKSYRKTKPMLIQEFDREKSWWNKHEENEYAWRVSVNDIKASGYNLDIKNPNSAQEQNGDPDQLLADYQNLCNELDTTRNKLRDELIKALGSGKQ